jgi:hypothetical protein
LVLAAAAFLGWLGFLSYAALTKSSAPIVSHIQSAAAEAAVVVELDGLGPNATVVEGIWGDAPEGSITIANLGEAAGFTGPGKYLVYLQKMGGAWEVVGPQRSPGDSSFGPPVIYPWSEDVRKQAVKLQQQ